MRRKARSRPCLRSSTNRCSKERGRGCARAASRRAASRITIRRRMARAPGAAWRPAVIKPKRNAAAPANAACHPDEGCTRLSRISMSTRSMQASRCATIRDCAVSRSQSPAEPASGRAHCIVRSAPVRRAFRDAAIQGAHGLSGADRRPARYAEIPGDLARNLRRFPPSGRSGRRLSIDEAFVEIGGRRSERPSDLPPRFGASFRDDGSSR